MTIDLDEMRAVADDIRSIAEPVRTVSVTVRTRTWSGARVGAGTPSDSDRALGNRYRVRELSEREVSSSGGRFEVGDLRIGPITPAFVANGGGGHSKAQLDPAGAANVEIRYVLTGDIVGDYRPVAFHTARPLGYLVTVRRMRTTP